MDIRKYLAKILTLQFFGWAMLVVLLYLGLVYNIAPRIDEAPCKAWAYIMESLNGGQTQCTPLSSSIAIVTLIYAVVVLLIAIALVVKYKCMKRKPTQVRKIFDLQNMDYIIPMEQDSMAVTSV